MSGNGAGPFPSGRPGAVTGLAVAVGVLGLGQAFCAGLLPGPNAAGLLMGAVLLAIGALLFFVRGLWQMQLFSAYLSILVGLLCLVMAVNGWLGLGLAEYKVPLFFVGAFLLLGAVFITVGGLMWNRAARR